MKHISLIPIRAPGTGDEAEKENHRRLLGERAVHSSANGMDLPVVVCGHEKTARREKRPWKRIIRVQKGSPTVWELC